MHDEEFEFRSVDDSNWDDLVGLFDGRGGPKFCWCMVWRKKPPALKSAAKSERRELLKSALRGEVASGRPIGILAYRGGRSVAWCSIAPREFYRPLGGLPSTEHGFENVWSLVCFYISSKFRRTGLKGKLLRAAVETARQHGATAIEAYPADQDSPSYGFMGRVEFYKREKFEIVGRVGTRRSVARLELQQPQQVGWPRVLK
ncbi:MAG: GNAT family N-acetyltransferase [Albidovulum sp.]|nr:GNAT family N-acetyltransferase [Albidovulum sp.]